MLENIVSKVNDIVLNPGLVGLLILAGLYFSFRTRFGRILKRPLCVIFQKKVLCSRLNIITNLIIRI